MLLHLVERVDGVCLVYAMAVRCWLCGYEVVLARRCLRGGGCKVMVVRLCKVEGTGGAEGSVEGLVLWGGKQICYWQMILLKS